MAGYIGGPGSLGAMTPPGSFGPGGPNSGTMIGQAGYLSPAVPPNQNTYSSGYGQAYGGNAGGYGYGYGDSNGWDQFSRIYPQYQQLMWNNNASANAAMNRIGGHGASSGTPYSSALGQLAMQGASGLQSLFAGVGGRRGGGGYGGYVGDPNAGAYARQDAEARLPWNDINNTWYGNEQGYKTYQRQAQQKMLESNADNPALNYAGYVNQLTGLQAGASQNKFSGSQADANRSLIPGQTELSGAQTQQALIGLRGSGELQAGQTQQALNRLGNSSPTTPPPGNPSDYVWQNGQWVYAPGKGRGYLPTGGGPGPTGSRSGY